jgi:hypothetical protein
VAQDFPANRWFGWKYEMKPTLKKMSLPRHAAAVATSISALFFNAALKAAEPVQDAGWYKKNATLIFEDSFDREETGNGLKAIGNGWESATADRVPQIKQADLDQGILKVASATKEAGHGAHIHHDAGFQDGAVSLRFKLPGLNPDERLQVGFVDRECKTVHAGHLGYAFITAKPGSIMLKDSKTGSMSLEVKNRSEEGRKATGKVPDDIVALLKTKEVSFSWASDTEWHDLLLAVDKDVLRVSVDGKSIGELKSEGFAHPVKRWLSFGFLSTAWIDDVRIWKVR